MSDDVLADAEAYLRGTRPAHHLTDEEVRLSLLRRLLEAVAAERQGRERAEESAMRLTKMLRHIAHVATGDEDGDSQRGVERLLARAEQAEHEVDQRREQEGLLFRTLSDSLTRGNAGTWAEIVHAAESLQPQDSQQ